MKGRESLLFVNKKKQKNFENGSWLGLYSTMDKSFLLLFSKKEDASFSLTF